MEPSASPYAGVLEQLLTDVLRKAAHTEPLQSPHAGADEAVRDAAGAVVSRLADDLVELSHDIHAHPELGYEEHHAVATVAALLSKHGHDAETGAYGVPTALRARAGSGRPRVAILAEYDALPGLGHACGHNVICATAVGAFLAAAEVISDLDGSVELIGTPAEEGGGGKELIARAGGFDEIDAVVMLHPAGFEAAEHPWIGVRTVDITYTGVAAHAAAMPFMGRNALDAAVNAYTAMAQLRQHMLPTDRVHGIITDGGQKPNIVPERAALTFYLRSAQPETLAILVQRAEEIFHAAAASTGTTVELGWDPTPVYLPVRNNHPLAARWASNAATTGRRSLPIGVIPEALTGSTDLGNVSVRVPSIHPTLAIAPPGATIHSPEFVAHARSAAADQGVLDGAVGLALTALDYLGDADLRAAVAEDFEAGGGVLDVEGIAVVTDRVVVWHNAHCSKSRGACALLQEQGVDAEVVRYLDDPPSRAELERVLGLLGWNDPRAMMRTGEAVYREQGLESAGRDELLDAMVAHPILIERPIVIRGDSAVIGRPPERVLELLAGA